MTTRLGVVSAILVSMTIGLAGCSVPAAPLDDSAPAASSAAATFSAADIMFAQMMIPHHQQAVDMSDLALTRSTNADVLALAAEIKAAQAPEIDQMTGWLSASGAGMDMGHSMHMDGMLSDEQMTALAAAQGVEFDKLYLTGMIQHHEGAISMAQMVIDSTNVEASTLGHNIVTSQTAEIERMNSLLSGL